MGTLKVNSITNEGGDGPVTFENGIVASADNLLLKPGVTSFTPNNLAVDVDTATNIEIGFNQNMQFTGIGTIHIRSGSASGSIVTSFTCGVSTEAVIVNNVLTINPKDDLPTGTVFYVTLPSAGIANTVGSFIDPITSYNFKTEFTPFNIQGGDYEQIIVSPTSPTGYYKYNIFTSSGIATFTSPSASATDFTYVMVGGGGGGGSSVNGTPYPGMESDGGGGGGGAGGYVKNYNSTNLPAKNYNVTIGGGGSGCWSWPGGLESNISPGNGNVMGNFPGPWPTNQNYLANYSVVPTSGNNSSFGPTPVGTIIAYGGGAGGYGSVRGNAASSPSEWNYNPRTISWGERGYLPSNVAPPGNPAWYPSPYNIIPQPSNGPYNHTVTRPANLWITGGRPGGSGGGHSGKGGYAPYRYFYKAHGHSKLSVTAASAQAYPSPNSQGYPGGAYQISTPVPGTYMVGSGGGGAGGSGGAGGRSTSGTYPPTPPGQGGSGKPTPEFPSPVLSLIPGFPQALLDTLGSSGMLAGGGGGSKYIYYPYPHPTYNDYVRQGGSGGGGNGYQRIPTTTQLSERGAENSGGGGGAGGREGGPTAPPLYQTTYNGYWLGQNGGSGIMMFRYAHPGS